MMKHSIQQTSEEIRILEQEYRSVHVDTSNVNSVNSSLRRAAQEEARLSDIQTKRVVLEQDIMRIEQLIASGALRTGGVVSYTVPHPDTQRRAQELKKLVQENLRLVAEIKRKFGVSSAGGATGGYTSTTTTTQYGQGATTQYGQGATTQYGQGATTQYGQGATT